MACYGNSEYEDSVSESESNSEAKLIKFQQVIREKTAKCIALWLTARMKGPLVVVRKADLKTWSL